MKLKYIRNKYNHYSLTDLLLDDSFVDWIRAGKPDDNVWVQRIRDSSKLEVVASGAEKILIKLKPKSGYKNPQQVAYLKTRILQKVETLKMRDQFGTYTQPRSFKYSYFVAAAVTLLILFSGVYFSMISTSESVLAEVQNYVIRKTKRGQKLTIHLNDGSTVKLNSDSEIKYQKHFGSTRVIELIKGEAFFEVARDTLRPFRVITDNTEIEALGTSFNIKLIRDNLTRIALVTGKVKVKNNLDREILLSPGKLITCTTSDFSNIENYDLSEIAWKDEILIFNDATGQEILAKLEEWYGVEIQCNMTNLDEWRYSSRFENQNLYQVLTSIGAVEQFDFKIQDEIVIINPKSKNMTK